MHKINTTMCSQGRREVFGSEGQTYKIKPLVSVLEASRGGRKQGFLWELDLETLLEPCRLLLLGDSLNSSGGYE